MIYQAQRQHVTSIPCSCHTTCVFAVAFADNPPAPAPVPTSTPCRGHKGWPHSSRRHTTTGGTSVADHSRQITTRRTLQVCTRLYLSLSLRVLVSVMLPPCANTPNTTMHVRMGAQSPPPRHTRCLAVSRRHCPLHYMTTPPAFRQPDCRCLLLSPCAHAEHHARSSSASPPHPAPRSSRPAATMGCRKRSGDCFLTNACQPKSFAACP